VRKVQVYTAVMRIHLDHITVSALVQLSAAMDALVAVKCVICGVECPRDSSRIQQASRGGNKEEKHQTIATTVGCQKYQSHEEER
jgi:hypothetical protein